MRGDNRRARAVLRVGGIPALDADYGR